MVVKCITVSALSVKFIKTKFHNPVKDMDFAIKPVAVMAGVIKGGDTPKVCAVNFGEVPIHPKRNAWLGTGVEVDEVFLDTEEEEMEGPHQFQPGNSPGDHKDVKTVKAGPWRKG